MKVQRTKSGFTLIEVLLVIGILAILAGIVIVAINPARQIGLANNAQRWSDVNTILNGISQYAVENNGLIPASIPAGSNCEGEEFYRICQTGAADCSNLVDLSVLTDDGTYLVSMPLNPGLSGTYFTGYNAIQSTNGRVTVCAPDAYNDETISVTR
jgi:type IV pilus assembly protein PilA